MPPRISTGATRPQIASRRLARTAAAAGRFSARPSRACATASTAGIDQREPASTPGIMPAANSAGTEAPRHQHRIDDERDRRRDQDVGGRRRADHAGRERPADSRRAPWPPIITPPTAAALAGPEPEMPPRNIATSDRHQRQHARAAADDGDGEVHQPQRHAGAVEDGADQHEHRDGEQRVLGDAGVEVLRHGQQAEPLRRRRWRARCSGAGQAERGPDRHAASSMTTKATNSRATIMRRRPRG